MTSRPADFRRSVKVEQIMGTAVSIHVITWPPRALNPWLQRWTRRCPPHQSIASARRFSRAPLLSAVSPEETLGWQTRIR